PEPPEPGYEETVVSDPGEEWRYRKGTAPFSDPPLAWTTEDFDDSGWLLGPSSFGFGYPDQLTELDDMHLNYTTLAVRKRFVLTEEEIDGPGYLRLGLKYDDGFCAFINGTEFASSFCRVVEWDAVTRELHEALTEEFFHIDAALLKPGENVLAVFGVTRIDFNFRLDPRVTHRVRVDEDEIVEFRGRFNELFRGDGSGDSWVELVNAGNTTLDLGGLLVTEDPSRVEPYVIPEGTTLGSKKFLVLRESDTSLRLSGEKVQLFLLDSDGQVVRAAAFDRVPPPNVSLDAYSEVRFPDGADAIWITDDLTPGAANVVSRVTDIVINEIFYNPPEDRVGEFLELYHRGADGVIDLSGFRFDSGIDYTFPEGTSLAPGEYLVLSEDPDVLRDRYGLAGVHRYEGGLANGGENVRLVDGLGNLVDEVRYFDGGRWSSWADGRGSSLELIDPAQDNDFAFAWDASDESDKAEWERLSYVMPLYKRGSNGGSEFHIFLAERGVCLIDDVSIAPPEYDGSSLLGLGAEWKYRKGTEAFSDPPLAWIAPEFDDSDWLVGETPMGFRFLDLNTVLRDMRGRYTSVAARTTFSITRELLDSPEDIFFGITFDDGFCAFLNGVELDRENCPEDVTWDAVATRERVGPEKVIAIPRDLLVVGENLLAVVGFNRSVGNNDFVIAPRVALRSGNGPNVIKNPGFEDDTASWQIQGTHVDSRRITVDSRSGDACLELVATGKGDNLCNRIGTDPSPTPEETGYDVSLWARWQRGSSLLILHGDFAPGPMEWSNNRHQNMATNNFGARLRMTVPRNLGTPGEENSVRARLRAETGSDNLGPVIAEVHHLPFSPDPRETVHVVARVADRDGVAAVRVVFSDDVKSGEFEERELFDDGVHDDGDPGDGVYGGEIPGFSASKRVVFFVEAEDTEQVVGRFPRGAPEKTLVYMVEGPVSETVQVVMDDRNRESLALRSVHSNYLLDGALVYKNDDVYNVGLRYRGSSYGGRRQKMSYRVRFPKDQKFHRGRNEINISNRDIDEGIWYPLVSRNSAQATPAPAFDYHYVTTRFDGESIGAPGMSETVGRDFFEKWYGQEAVENVVCLKAIGRIRFDNVCQFANLDGATLRHMEESAENYRFYWNH
ncbi:MAG: lamin tail domain-containing protein, partial [Planctomycetes bacterium]|nr:lamin tail domain-containing protein [Planctomycetota bacterium]